MMDPDRSYGSPMGWEEVASRSRPTTSEENLWRQFTDRKVKESMWEGGIIQHSVSSFLCNAPVNLIPHLPPPGLTKGIGEDLTFRKIKFPTHRRTSSGQIPMSNAEMHFRILINSQNLWVENYRLKSWVIKCPIIGTKILVQIGSKSPTNPLVSPGGSGA